MKKNNESDYRVFSLREIKRTLFDSIMGILEERGNDDRGLSAEEVDVLLQMNYGFIDSLLDEDPEKREG